MIAPKVIPTRAKERSRLLAIRIEPYPTVMTVVRMININNNSNKDDNMLIILIKI